MPATPEKSDQESAELPWHPDDWPESFHRYLDELPDVDHELSELLDQASGLKALATASEVIHNSAAGVGQDPEPGELPYDRARLMAPMREDVARSVLSLHRRLDRFFTRLHKYQMDAQDGALRLAVEDGGSEGGAS